VEEWGVLWPCSCAIGQLATLTMAQLDAAAPIVEMRRFVRVRGVVAIDGPVIFPSYPVVP
jgi:hypothetical protein